MRRIAAVPGLDSAAFAHAEQLLADTARTVAPRATECAARELLARLDPDGVAPVEDDEPDTTLLVQRRRDGSLCGRSRIAERADAETVAIALEALAARRDADDLRDLGQRQGQALVWGTAGGWCPRRNDAR